jgi:hypothetical protein
LLFFFSCSRLYSQDERNSYEVIFLKMKHYCKILLAFALLSMFSVRIVLGCTGHSLTESEIDSIIEKSDHWPTDSQKKPIGQGTPILVEIYDYLCGHCKTSHRAIQNVRAQGQKFTVIYRPMGKLGPHSENATKAALAAHLQGKFLRFNDYLMRTPNFPSEDVILEAARFARLDLTRFKKDRRSPQIEAMLKENQALAEQLNIRTVPSFLLDECHIPHSMSEAQLTKALKSQSNRSAPFLDRFLEFIKEHSPFEFG